MRNYQSTEHSKNAPDKRKSWGIPELKQYPLDTISDLKTAIAHFKFCPKEYKIHLAFNIISRARVLGVEINNTEVLEWASRWY